MNTPANAEIALEAVHHEVAAAGKHTEAMNKNFLEHLP